MFTLCFLWFPLFLCRLSELLDLRSIAKHGCERIFPISANGARFIMILVRLILILCLAGNPASGDVEKLKPGDPQRSELESKAFKAKELISNASPERPIPQLYRAWRNPRPQPRQPGEKLLSFPQIQLRVKQPTGELAAWDKKMWESGKMVRSLEVNKEFAIVLDSFSLKDFKRLVYKRNRSTSEEDSRKGR